MKKGVTTFKGRVVYNRKPHKLLMSDVVRLVTKMNNERIGYFVPWRAIYRIALRNMEFYAYEEKSNIPPELLQVGKSFEEFLRGFDMVLSIVAPVLTQVPGAGELLSGAYELYKFVRETFPVY